MQENDAFSKNPAPFVLDRPPKLIQRFTINVWRYCGPWCHEFCQQNSLTVPEYSSHHHSAYLTAGGSGDDSVHVSSVIKTYSLTTQPKCMRAGIQRLQTLRVTNGCALWRYGNAFLFTNKSEFDFGIAHVSKLKREKKPTWQYQTTSFVVTSQARYTKHVLSN